MCLIVERCEFESIIPNQILRDNYKLVFGIHDSKVRERLLCDKNLSLEKTDEICRSHETCMVQQMRVVGDASLSVADARNLAFGRSCNKCGKKNHFANICFGHAPKPTTRTHPVYCFKDELLDEVFGVEGM